LSPHLPPVFNHCLQTFFVPFSDQLLDSEELRDLEALDPGVNPVELPDRDELFENVRLPVLLGYLLLENFLGDCGRPGDALLPFPFPGPLPEGVTLNAFPRGVVDRPLPLDRGLCPRGLWPLGLCPRLEDALRPLDVLEYIEFPPSDLDLEVFLG